MNEPEAPRFARAIAQSAQRYMSSVNWLETMMVMEARQGSLAADQTLLILSQLGVQMLPFDAMQMHEAHEAFRRYGKGRHPAALNMGDCCAYAVAKTEERPLLFKGQGFERTDIEKAVW